MTKITSISGLTEGLYYLVTTAYGQNVSYLPDIFSVIEKRSMHGYAEIQWRNETDTVNFSQHNFEDYMIHEITKEENPEYFL